MTLDTSPRTYRFLPADIMTSGYRVVGKIMITNNGVMGMMNDATHSAMEVNDARLARLHMPTKLVDHFELIRMMKRQIHAVCLARREDLGPLALVRGGYASVVEHPVRIATQMFEGVTSSEPTTYGQWLQVKKITSVLASAKSARL